MSTYVLMRILESAPSRYDAGMRLLTLGRLGRVYDGLVERIRPGDRVLDLGTGTGALAVRAARRGASVRGMDVNAAMLEIAAKRARDAGVADQVELVERGVAELDGEESGAYDVVTSGLCFSELGAHELDYALEHAARVLKPGGLLLVADEVRSQSPFGRAARAALRAPLVVLTYALTQQTTRAVERLPERVTAAGFTVEEVRTSRFASLAALVARRP